MNSLRGRAVCILLPPVISGTCGFPLLSKDAAAYNLTRAGVVTLDSNGDSIWEDAAFPDHYPCLKAHWYQFNPFKWHGILITAARAFPPFHTITRLVTHSVPPLSSPFICTSRRRLFRVFFNFQITCPISCRVCCFPARKRMAGLWVDWWADESFFFFFLSCVYVSRGLLARPSQMCVFSQVPVVSRAPCVYDFVDDVCVCVCDGVILIWALSISRIGVEGQYVPSNNIPLETHWECPSVMKWWLCVLWWFQCRQM